MKKQIIKVLEDNQGVGNNILPQVDVSVMADKIVAALTETIVIAICDNCKYESKGGYCCGIPGADLEEITIEEKDRWRYNPKNSKEKTDKVKDENSNP